MQQHFQMFAAYNRWANQRVYDAAAALSDAQYREDRGAFFKSLHGTLNHILVGDRVWMHRFTGEGPSPARLDEILFEDFAGLRAAREAEDARIIAWVDTMDDAKLKGSFRYRRVTGPEEMEQGYIPAIAHFFNHQTHHRGQAHGLLTALSGTAPELDLLYYQRAAGPRIYHNQNCSTSRTVLEILRSRGIEPMVIEYLKTPLTRAEIAGLARKMNVPVRDIVRAKEPLYAELNLANADDDALLDAMTAHPILLNRPIVVTPKGAKLCRPSETVAALL